MYNFDFSNRTRVIFGKGEQKRVGELLKPLAKKVLFHYGGSSIKKSGLYDEVITSLKENGVDFVELAGAQPNPRVPLVRSGIELIKKENVDFILAVGGGSTIDSAKAMSMGIYYEGDVWEIYEKSIMVTKTMPVATILTIPAAGSETSNSSVISNEENGMKRGCNNNLTRPVFSIINPEFFFTLPKNQIANGVADMMSHIFERYFTDTPDTDLIDGMCESVLRTIMKNAVKVYDNPQDYDAWCQVGFGGTVAHNDLLGVGRGQEWACHGMEHELSAKNDVAHGAGLAVLTPAWMKYVYKDNLNMFVQFAKNVMGVEGGLRDPEAFVLDAITKLSDFYKRIGLAQTLTDIGIYEKDFEEMAKRATRAFYGNESPLGGVKKLKWQDVVEIFKIAK
ncbi:MAG: iron-containing alcohol dehydrogenase [Clostridiales bacterium]|nr:iron-containing alcohol dehydrogenase [Clostridiales bacterium]